MTSTKTEKRMARCACGACEMTLVGAPIVTSICYCASCQAAGAKLETLVGERSVPDADGGTAFVMQRKDRVACARGAEHLAEFRLTPSSSTRRVVATCCNTPMFLEFKGGHWLSIYRDRLPKGQRPPVDLRTMIADRRAGVEFSDGLPSYRKHSGRFMWRLLTAWAAMGFRAPRIDYVRGELGEGVA